MQLPNNLIGWQPFERRRIKTEFKSCFHIQEIDFSCFRLLWITFTWMISLLVEKKKNYLPKNNLNNAQSIDNFEQVI